MDTKVEEKPQEKRIVSLKGSANVTSELKAEAKVAKQELVKKEIVVLPSGEYTFGKPKLKHRKAIVKIWDKLTTASVNFQGAQQVMEGRGLENIKQLAAIPEDEFTPEEVALLMEGVGGEKNMKDIVDVMADVLFITLKKAPFEFTTLEKLEDELDFDEGLELAQNGILWIKDTVITMKERKNLQRLSSQESEQ